MADEPLYKMSIQDINGNYYQASLNQDTSWSVTTNPAITYLSVLPDGWNETAITWERELTYLGIFRSMSNAPYKFSMDARQIILKIAKDEGVQGYGLLTIYKLDAANSTPAITYPVYYQSELDFKTYRDAMMTELCEIGTLDSKAIRYLHSRGDTKFNIPIWKNIGTLASPVWVQNDSEWIWHDGIKLLYNATYVSTASDSNPLIFANSSGTALSGYARGQFGTSPNEGAHTLLFLSQYQIEQNNGTTTFIGNDILQPFLKQGNQSNGFNAPQGANEKIFWGQNDSRPYTRENYSLKNLLSSAGSFDMYVSVQATIPTSSTLDIIGGGSHGITSPFLGFVMWEINNTSSVPPGFTQFSLDMPPIVSLGGGHSGMQYIPLTQVALTGASTPGPGDINVTVPVTIKYNKCYVFGLVFDDMTSTGIPIEGGGGFQLEVRFTKLQFSILSKYDSGASGAPIPAPILNASPAAAFRVKTLFQKLIEVLPSLASDNFGFPIAPVSDFTLTSDYLDNPATNPNAPSAPIGDVIPWNLLITSSYCLKDLIGQSYISISFHQLFDMCQRVLGCGLSVIGDTFTIENLRHFFDGNTMILDLGYSVAELEITQDLSKVGANLKLGYAKADTNTDFGVDPVCTGLYFDTPAINIPQEMDFQEDGVSFEMYQIEKERVQKTNQPPGTVIDPQSPSNNSQAYAIYCESSPITVTNQMVDPDGNILPSVQAFKPQKYSNAQSTDPFAFSAPYLQGWYYPDTAINVPCTPCRALLRDVGALIHSVLDKMDSDYLVFRNTYVIQLNTNQSSLVSVGLSGFSSKLDVGVPGLPISEFTDKLIGDLPPKLFLPIQLKVKSTSAGNLYQVLNSNPNGYIRFFWKNKGVGYTEYHMFLTKATQIATPNGNIETEFDGWAAPSNPAIGYVSPV